MCEQMNEMRATLKFRNRINRSWCAVVNLKFIPQYSPNLFLKFCICVPSTPLVAISSWAVKSDQPTVTISSKAKFLASPDGAAIQPCYAFQFSSVAQSCLTLCIPMDCSTLGFPVLHQLLEFAQTHVHCVSDAIQTSHSLSSPSPPAFYLSRIQGLFQ